jgi:hypothetical protein
VFNGRQLASEWRPLIAVLGEGEPGDFSYLTAGVLGCRTRVWDELSSHIGGELECLRLQTPGEEYCLLNVTGISDALDLSSSVVERFPSSNRVFRVPKIVLRGEKVAQRWLFKIPELARTEIFATDAFRDLCTTRSLTGLEFNAVETI